jgi:hypothetical protein
MAVADPLLAVTLTRLPAPAIQLAALGVVKAIAVFLESPIIMVLHASTALSGWTPARQALGRFVAGVSGVLTVILLGLSWPPVYAWLSADVYSLKAPVAAAARGPLLILCLWPAIIAWRRYHQGHLILQGRGRFMGLASLARVIGFIFCLLLGVRLGWDGAIVGAGALMAGLGLEAVLVYAWSRQAELGSQVPNRPLPENVGAVSRYYAPLAFTMLLMWGGRAALIAILARAEDHELALAAWAASWGFVILLANLTRMVQQLVIKYAAVVPPLRLMALGFWAGTLCSLLLAALGHTLPGKALLGVLIGHDAKLWAAAQAVVSTSVCLPLLVAAQNVLQGFSIVAGKNTWINGAGLVGLGLTLSLAQWGVNRGLAGATVGAVAVALGLVLEVGVLASVQPWRGAQQTTARL